jgi:hypothetical protein
MEKGYLDNPIFCRNSGYHPLYFFWLQKLESIIPVHLRCDLGRVDLKLLTVLLARIILQLRDSVVKNG